MAKRSRRIMLKRRQELRRRFVIGIGLFVMVLVMVVSCSIQKVKQKEAAATKAATTNQKKQANKNKIEITEKEETEQEQVDRVRKMAKALGYPAEVIGLLDKSSETADFVEHYEKGKDKAYAQTIGNDLVEGQIPLLLQWDERWGYAPYGKSNIAVNGCGPTCMAMVIAGLTKDATVTPEKLAAFSTANGYIDTEDNTLWLFMEAAARQWNVQVAGLPMVESMVQEKLQAGNPIICSVTQGDFTQNGHFIVLTGYENGSVTVNDPFSEKNSEKTWVFSEIQDQISSMWVYSL